MDFLDRTLENFREYLKENTESKNTVKNYVSDLRIFLIFLDSRHSPLNTENFPHLLNSQTLTEFESYLSVINPPATLNRRVSSVKKFFDYYMEHHPLPTSPQTPIVTFSSTTPTHTETSQSPLPDSSQIINNPVPSPTPPDEMPVPTNSINPDSATTNNLLRLLPQELTEEINTTAGGQPTAILPSGFLSKYGIYIICTVSFFIGFVSTLALYPILYP